MGEDLHGTFKKIKTSSCSSVSLDHLFSDLIDFALIKGHTVCVPTVGDIYIYVYVYMQLICAYPVKVYAFF